MKKILQHLYNKYDKNLKNIEDHSITLIIILILFFIIGNKVLIHFNIEFALDNFDKYLTINLKKHLTTKEGVLTNVAAVFIGIYFTVFTLLSSIKIESTFAMLTEGNFRRLLRFIRNAFIGSLLYLFYSLFSSLITNIWLSIIINIVLLIYMLLSALRFCLVIYSIFTKDLNNFHQQLKDEKNERKNISNLYKRLDAFLSQQEHSQDTKKSLELVDKMRQRDKSIKKRD
ncbi:hypothetical protein ACIQWQ_26065 [Peribacillus frigoritolerans]